jgi:putative hydrolase of the HAD superfamily
VIVFDLDDTLYPEIEFVQSGFKAVAQYFHALHPKHSTESLYTLMLQELEQNGRGKVFDVLLESLGCKSKKMVRKALSIYRMHIPTLTLPQESKEILEYFTTQNIPLYIVTDGNKIVQANKIKALNVEKFLKKSFITHRYGKIHAKPSPYCFVKIAEREGVEYEDIVYIADNSNKDFVAIKKLGFRTIRIKQGMFEHVQNSKEYHAEREIESLLELKTMIKRSL